MSNSKKEALLDFIMSYRSLPELWDVESSDYSNRLKKAAAYDILIEKLKVIEPDATRESVVKKINNLRSAFRKELKKVNDSKKLGACGDVLYTPTLWYFNELMFLVGQEAHEPILTTEFKEDESSEFQCSIVATPSYSNVSSHSKKRKSSHDPHPGQHFLAAASRYLEKEDDEFLIMGMSYAVKLRKLTPEQLIFADRVINEALVEAQLGRLTRWSYITDSGASLNPPSAHSWTDGTMSPPSHISEVHGANYEEQDRRG